MEHMLEDFRKIFCKHVDVEPEEVTLDARLVEDLDVNSYDLVCMIEELNNAFGITVDAHRACGLITVKEALEYFSSLKDTKKA